MMETENNIVVYGKSSVLFKDDIIASKIENGDHLIEWNDDKELCLWIDKYDGRVSISTLNDLLRASGNSRTVSDENDCDIDELLFERYQDLLDCKEEDLIHLNHRNDQNGVEISYNYEPSTDTKPQLFDENSEKYFLPEFVTLPVGIKSPIYKKEFDIIIHTAKNTRQSKQLEILLKLKQDENPLFEFLRFDSELHPFYQYLTQISDNKFWSIYLSKPELFQDDVAETKNDDSKVPSQLASASGAARDSTNEVSEAVMMGESRKSSNALSLLGTSYESEEDDDEEDMQGSQASASESSSPPDVSWVDHTSGVSAPDIAQTWPPSEAFSHEISCEGVGEEACLSEARACLDSLLVAVSEREAAAEAREGEGTGDVDPDPGAVPETQQTLQSPSNSQQLRPGSNIYNRVREPSLAETRSDEDSGVGEEEAFPKDADEAPVVATADSALTRGSLGPGMQSVLQEIAKKIESQWASLRKSATATDNIIAPQVGSERDSSVATEAPSTNIAPVMAKKDWLSSADESSSEEPPNDYPDPLHANDFSEDVEESKFWMLNWKGTTGRKVGTNISEIKPEEDPEIKAERLRRAKLLRGHFVLKTIRTLNNDDNAEENEESLVSTTLPATATVIVDEPLDAERIDDPEKLLQPDPSRGRLHSSKRGRSGSSGSSRSSSRSRRRHKTKGDSRDRKERRHRERRESRDRARNRELKSGKHKRDSHHRDIGRDRRDRRHRDRSSPHSGSRRKRSISRHRSRSRSDPGDYGTRGSSARDVCDGKVDSRKSSAKRRTEVAIPKIVVDDAALSEKIQRALANL